MLTIQAVSAIFEEFDLPEEVEVKTLKALISELGNLSSHPIVLSGLIREFLRLRWATIENTALAYPLSPNNRVNQFCIRLAEVIVKDDEAIIKLLIPTLVERDYVAGSLQALTETEINGKRRLITSEPYFLLDNNTTLLPIIDWFEYLSDPAAPHYFHLYTNNNQAVPLSDAEKTLLRNSCGELSKTLFKQLEYYRELALSSSSLYGAVKMLISGLKKGGVSNERNKELIVLRNRIAGPQSDEAAEKFLSLWAAIPDSVEKQAMLDLRSAVFTPDQAKLYESPKDFEKHHPSLGDYLLVLRDSLAHTLTEEEKNHLIAQELYNCVEEISLGLNEIVKVNQAAFENFTMAHFEGELPAPPVFTLNFEALKTQVIEYLKQNPAIQKPCAEGLNCSPELYASLLNQLNKYKITLKLGDLKDLLFLHKWHSEKDFLSIVRAMLQDIKDGFLFRAVKYSKPQIIPVLIQEGANFCQTFQEHNLLTIALEKNWQEVLDTLYEKNLTLLPEAWLQNNSTPLQDALHNNNSVAFKKILENIKKHLSDEAFLAALMIEDSSGDNLFSTILRKGSEEAVNLLVQAGASSIFKEKNSLGKNALHQAAHCDKLNMLKKFLEVTEPSLLLVQNAYGQTPLESAVFSAKNETVELLMSVYKKNNFALELPLNTSYSMAIARKQISWMLKLLVLDEKKEINLSQANNGLTQAMTHSNIPLMCELIKRDAKLSALTPHGSILHYALKNNWTIVIDALFDRSEDELNALMKSRSAENKSPLDVAHPELDTGTLQKLQALTKHRAAENAQDPAPKKLKH